MNCYFISSNLIDEIMNLYSFKERRETTFLQTGYTRTINLFRSDVFVMLVISFYKIFL